MSDNKKLLLPDRHPNKDFFLCDILDAAPKDDLGSMEHPIFSLATKPDIQVRRYEHNGNTLEVIPSMLGMATIWDKDVLIYCISQIVEGINRGREDIGKTVRVTVYDLLVSTNKATGGINYKRLQASLDRLSGTRLKTNIATNGEHIKEGFGLIDKWKIIEKSKDDDKMIAVEITLSDWLFNAAVGKDILTINQDYFRLRKALERRLYELARKHCGRKQAKWKIGLEKLQKKSGSRTSLKEFRRNIKTVVLGDHLPDYEIFYDRDRDMVTVYSRNDKGHQAKVTDAIQGSLF